MNIPTTDYEMDTNPLNSNEVVKKNISNDQPRTTRKFKFMENQAIKLTIVFFVLTFAHLTTSGYTVLLRVYGVTNNLDPLLIILCRNLFGIISTPIIARITEGPIHMPEIQKDFWFFVIFSVIFVYVCTLAYVKTTYLISGSFTSIMGQTVPIYTYVISLFLGYEERPNCANKGTIIKPIGLIVSISSAIFITSYALMKPNKGVTTTIWLLGTFYAVFGRLLFSLYYIFQAKYFFKNNSSPLQHKPFTVSFYVELMAAIETLPFTILYLLMKYDEIIPHLTLRTCIPILYTMITSIIVKVMITWCNQNSNPAVVGCSYSIQVTTSYILLYIFANEKLDIYQYIASAGVVFGVFIAILGPIFYNKFIAKRDI